MEDKNKLSAFLVKLASLMDTYEVAFDYTNQDDGIHFICGTEEVAIMSPKSSDLIQEAMILSSNIGNNAN
ncbi:hypothetical protein HUO09_17345 [Vibrio sp. Y2-5]|uniref:hypothetical protein n=1 Tax=Vibrio sp. Y2-5 TaxID=2743977 RepID=UPI001660D6CF|nr:hypothetical protein [Vibrio sp. Y2-5]MBD0788122.1 hypothetical protein [Vibrio sp. Y2-5]